MKTYRYEQDWNGSVIDIGDVLTIDSQAIRVISIVKVDFGDKILWFSGITVDLLN